jgi:hypothetical protein
MMDKELKMKLLEQLMAEMDDTSMKKFSKDDLIMPEGDEMVKVKEVKVDEVPMSKAPGMLKEKIAEAMKKDSEDDDMEMAMEDEDEEDDEYEGSSLMKRLKALKKG